MNKKIVSQLFGALLVVYLLYSVGNTLYQNWTVNKDVESLKSQISELKKENEDFQLKLSYYQSPSYREKIARERFGLQKPGEQVVVIVPAKEPKVTEEKSKDKKSNYLKWWDYFFGVDN